MKKIFLLLLISTFVFGWDKFYPSFHAEVVNVPKWDVLNIRSKPNYKSKKLGSIKPGKRVQIEYCLRSPKNYLV